MSSATMKMVVMEESLSIEDIFLLYEIVEMPASIRQLSTVWLERMLWMCDNCGEAGTLFNAIGAELLHRRGK